MDVRVGLWRRLSAEELMLLNCVLEKTLESPLDCKEIKPVNPKGNQSWIFIGKTDVEAPLLGHLMWRADSFEKSLILRKIEGRRRKGWQRMIWLDGITDSIDMNLCKLWEMVKDRGALWATVHGPQRVRRNWVTSLSLSFLEGPMLKPKLQYFGHLMRRTDSLEKTPKLGKIEGRRRKGWQRIRW